MQVLIIRTRGGAAIHIEPCVGGTSARRGMTSKEPKGKRSIQLIEENVLPDVMQEIFWLVDKATHEAMRFQLLRSVISLDRIGIEVLVERAPMTPPPGPVALDG